MAEPSMQNHLEPITDSSITSILSNVAEIFVVRHGETEYNATGIIQGHLDIKLNEAGRKQAGALATRVSEDCKFTAIYSSDLKRAFETAEIIAEKFKVDKVIPEPMVRERHLGDLQGVEYSDAPIVCPEAFNALKSSKTDVKIPGGGESVDELRHRCVSALETIARKHLGQQVLVVTHGGVLRELYNRAEPEIPLGRIQNTAINVFHISDSNEWTWTIKKWNDVSHLSDIGYIATAFGGTRTSG